MDTSPSENLVARTTDQAPRAVRILAYLFWLAAAAGLWNLLLSIILGRGFLIDFGIILFAFAALGFLRAREGWRALAMVLFALTTIGDLAIAAYASYHLAVGTTRLAFGSSGFPSTTSGSSEPARCAISFSFSSPLASSLRRCPSCSC